MKSTTMSTLLAVALAAVIVSSVGCQQVSNENAETALATPDQEASEAEVHSHSGWWCVEHAIPEEECSMCSASAAAKFKEQGDWCEEHNRAESQCFKCDPSRAEKYVRLYEAKYGHPPAEATD